MIGDRRAWPVLLVLCVVIAIATACGDGAPTPTVAPTSTPAPEPPASDVAGDVLPIVTQSGYTDSNGHTHVIGEVENAGEVAVRPVEVTGTFYDAGGATLATHKTQALVDVLYPGERAPFKLSLQSPPSGIASYLVTASGKQADLVPLSGLAFVQDQATMDEDDMTIVGEIVNDGEQQAYRISIAATVYDRSGALIDVATARAERQLLLPGETSPFKMFLGNMAGVPDRYALIAYGVPASPMDVARTAQIDLNSANRCPEASDRLVLCGEVTNRSRGTATHIKAIAAYYGQDGALIDVDWSYAWANVLAPGERSPFAISLYPVPAEVEHWFIWVQGEHTDQPAEGSLVIEAVVPAIDNGDSAVFEGQVRNSGPTPMTAIEIAITLYDGGGEVTNVHWMWLDEDLAPNATAPFQIEVPGAANAQAFGAYVQGSAVRE